MIENKNITAVMFVQNEEKFIAESLSFLLEQTIPVEKIIVVDDFSTDNTREIVMNYEKIDLIQNNKKGMAYACEMGLKLVETELFFLCHGDDIISKNYVKEMYQFISEKKIRYAYSNYIMTDIGMTPKRFINKKNYYNKYDLLHDCFTGGYLFGYSEIIPHLLPFPNGLIYEDWYIAIMLSQFVGDNYVNNKPLFKYRRHTDSDSTNIHNNKEKYLRLLSRSMDLLILIREIVSDNFSQKVIESRIQFYDAMINYTLIKTVRIIWSNQYTWREKLSVSLFPIILRLKYIG
tara:strand:- start:348 stop:1217 length:870 start_codon:yes stop_codon:yes gene_type:complete